MDIDGFVKEAMKTRNAMLDHLLIAFMAETGLKPSQIMLVERMGPAGIKYLYAEKKNVQPVSVTKSKKHNEEASRCKHCGVSIVKVNNFWLDINYKHKVFPQYCISSQPSEQMHEPNELYQPLSDAESNRDRFYHHLNKISAALGIDWWDGDFPIDEVLDKLRLHKP